MSKLSEIDRKYIIPQRLDDPPKFLWWDLDVALLFMSFAGFGIATLQMMASSFIGFFVAWGYQKMKAGRNRGFGLHVAYWNLPFDFFRIIPPSSVREFIG